MTYVFLFVVLLALSAFFSSAETSFLSLSRVRLAHRAKKGNPRAQIVQRILGRPEEFLSTVLIGNNLVNVAAATLATYVITRLFAGNQALILVAEMLGTTLLLLIFGEIVPKTFGYRFPNQLAELYAYPMRLLRLLFLPAVKGMATLSRSIVGGRKSKAFSQRELTHEEIKLFLKNETPLFRSSPETLAMINEVLDIARKDIKAIMVPRANMITLDEQAGFEELLPLLRDRGFSKVPLHRGGPHNITGIIHTHSVLERMIERKFSPTPLLEMAETPIFVSEYAGLPSILAEFRRRRLNMAVVVDEYGVAIGLVTLSDILRELLDEPGGEGKSITQLNRQAFLVPGSTPVEEVNSHLEVDLPRRKDYTTLSGLFIYHHGRFPQERTRIRLGSCQLMVKKMGKRKIDEIVLIRK